MPTSLILYLDSQAPLPNEFLGREAQAWFLQILRVLNPKLSQPLHDSDGHKPYTVSDVFELPPDVRRITPAARIIRITAFNDALEEVLTGPFIKHLPKDIRLWYLTIPIRAFSFSADESPWAGQFTYRNLAETAQALENEGICLEFISPTGFRSSGKDIAEPVPALVFRGCWQKWNLFAPQKMQMDADLPRFVQECVAARIQEDFELQRIVFAKGKRGGAVGFTGRVNFTIEQTAQSLEWAAGLAGWSAQVRALAMYAFFCGVGHHTTVGLGQTFPRLLPDARA